MDIQFLKDQNLIVQECISGSRAYGLATPTSDTDIKGVFVLPKNLFYAQDYTPQVNNPTNDEVYYELGRYIELLTVNNPNILELLSTPDDKVLYKHELMQRIQPELFLSKLCQKTFGQFAISQIKKATGLNKKIMNPMEKTHKSLIDFCYVAHAHGSVKLSKWLADKGWLATNCGLTKIDNMRDIYGLYHNPNANFNGIEQSKSVGQVALSSVPENEPQQSILYVNVQGYSAYCKDYKAYWTWVAERNEDRYKTNTASGRNYDTKNMMHVFRLLDMAIEIAEQGKVNVHRQNREFLLGIKQGNYNYEELMAMADKRKVTLEQVFANCELPEKPNSLAIQQLHVELRTAFYETLAKC